MNGVLPSQAITAMIARGEISADQPFASGQVQPASLDLRLGSEAFRVRASFLAGAGRPLNERLGEFEMHRIDLTSGAVLEKNCVYVVPLQERLALPGDVNAVANAKSSTARPRRPFSRAPTRARPIWSPNMSGRCPPWPPHDSARRATSARTPSPASALSLC